MADYGFSAVNDQMSVIITSTYKVMVFSERGVFNIRSRYTDRPGYGEVVFTKPILTQEPPQVFVRLQVASHPDLGLYITIRGGPGGWTGFQIVSAVRGGSALQDYTLEYVACKFADQPLTQKYGMEIRDANNVIVFSSQDKVVRYSKFAKNWTKTTGNLVDIYTSDVTIDADDFVCVSSIDRGVSWFIRGSRYAGITLYDNGARVLRMFNDKLTSGGYWYWQGTNNTCFAIPVCKFPTSRYSNN